jgi:hypothetical protein
MIPSPPIDHRPDTHFSCWFTTGSDQARIRSLDCTATPPAIGPAYGRPTPFHPRKPQSCKLRRAPLLQRSNLSKPKPAAKSP